MSEPLSTADNASFRELRTELAAMGVKQADDANTAGDVAEVALKTLQAMAAAYAQVKELLDQYTNMSDTDVSQVQVGKKDPLVEYVADKKRKTVQGGVKVEYGEGVREKLAQLTSPDVRRSYGGGEKMNRAQRRGRKGS